MYTPDERSGVFFLPFGSKKQDWVLKNKRKFDKIFKICSGGEI
jgi:hypothetical protein